jgi:hypothetical protein
MASGHSAAQPAASKPAATAPGSSPASAGQGSRGALVLELTCAAAALLWGVRTVAALLPARNPRLLPFATDAWEYLGFTAHFLDPSGPAPTAYRYPLFPWLASLLAGAMDAAPATGNLWLALLASALLPLALYLLGRQLAVAPVALAGALVGGALPLAVDFLGNVSDYLFCAWLLILTAAACSWAARGGRVVRHALAGFALALTMVATPKAITWLLFLLPLLVIGILAETRTRPRPAALRVLALLTPLLVAWILMGRGALSYNSLEHATDVVFQSWLGSAPVTSVHPDPGQIWPHNTGWIAGDWHALAGLPRTVAYLHEIAALGRAQVGLTDTLATLTADVLPARSWLEPLLWLAVLGSLGPLALRDRGTRWTVALVAAVFLVSRLSASASVPPRPRYHIATLLILPVYMSAGIALLPSLVPRLRRLGPWPWLTLPLLALWVVEPSGLSLGLTARMDRARYHANGEAETMAPAGELATLRPELRPEDRVIDLTTGGDVRAMLLSIATLDQVPGFAWSERPTTLTLPPQPHGRRLLYGGCRPEEPRQNTAWRLEPAPEPDPDSRLRRLSPCILEDIAPHRPGILSSG